MIPSKDHWEPLIKLDKPRIDFVLLLTFIARPGNSSTLYIECEVKIFKNGMDEKKNDYRVVKRLLGFS